MVMHIHSLGVGVFSLVSHPLPHFLDTWCLACADCHLCPHPYPGPNFIIDFCTKGESLYLGPREEFVTCGQVADHLGFLVRGQMLLNNRSVLNPGSFCGVEVVLGLDEVPPTPAPLLPYHAAHF